MADNPEQVPPLAACVAVLEGCGKTSDAQAMYAKLEPLARGADRDTPMFQRLIPIVEGWKSASWSPVEAADPTDAEKKIDLAELGPLTWGPYQAEPISGTDTDGKPWNLADHKGKNVLVLFYLGGQCAHCMQQLDMVGKEMEAFGALNTEVVAIGSDDAVATKALKENQDGIKFPMPLLSDPVAEPLPQLSLLRRF